MRRIRKTIGSLVLMTIMAVGVSAFVASCDVNRYITYEDGEFDSGEISLDEASDVLHLNSEIDLDDRERY